MPQSVPHIPLGRHVRRPAQRAFVAPIVTEMAAVLEPVVRDTFIDGCARPRSSWRPARGRCADAAGRR